MAISELISNTLQSPLKMAAISGPVAAYLSYYCDKDFQNSFIMGISTAIIVGFGAFNFRNPDKYLLATSALVVGCLVYWDRDFFKDEEESNLDKVQTATFSIALGIFVDTISYTFASKAAEFARG